MRLVTFVSAAGAQEIGALLDDDRTIVRLQAGAIAMAGAPVPAFATMLAFLRDGPAARERAQAVVDDVVTQRPPEATVSRETITLLAPLPRPESIRDCLSFEQHVINITRVAGLKRLAPFDRWLERRFGRQASLAARLNREWYRRPIYYKSNHFSVVGPDAAVRMPPYTRMFDYELEFAVVIGRCGVDITRRQAREYIGGYVIYNDFSARDIQFAEMGGRMGPTKGKDFDTGNALGPYLVTPDAVPDPYALEMTARVNGAEWSRGSSAEMYWSFEEIIAYITRAETIHPGEVIGSGACSGAEGSGCGWELGRFLKAGDVVELAVDGLGVLRNRVVGAHGAMAGNEDA